MPIMHVNRILPFNGTLDMPACYVAETFKPDGKIVLIDCSASMQKGDKELKLVLSAIKALSGMDTVPPVPAPAGTTNLAGKVKQVVEDPTFGSQQLMIITDGADNTDEVTEFIVGTTENGEPRTVVIEKESYLNTKDWLKARQCAILDYLEFIGASVHIIGIGNEVKEVLRMAASRPMTVAHIQPRASAADVSSVVSAVVKIRRDTPVKNGDEAQRNEEATSRIVTVDNLCGQPVAEQAQAAAVERDAGLVYIGNDAATLESFKAAFAAAEEAADVEDGAKTYMRATVLWLMRLSVESGFVPGALLGGKHGAVFKSPEEFKVWPVNKLLFQLSQAGLLTQRKEEEVSVVVENSTRNFTKVACYKAAPACVHLLPQVAADACWALPVEALVRSAGSKRKREAEASES